MAAIVQHPQPAQAVYFQAVIAPDGPSGGCGVNVPLLLQCGRMVSRAMAVARSRPQASDD